MQKKKFVDNLDLPAGYNNTNLTLIARDPYWIFAYWEIHPSALEKLKKEIGHKSFERASYKIRMHDVTSVDFNGKNANSSFDINIARHKGNSYINLPCDNVNYCAELGISVPDGKFFPLTMSNCTAVPRLSSSSRSDLVWIDSKNRKRQPFITLKEEKNGFSDKKIEDLPRKAKRMFLTEDDIRAYYSRIMPLHNRRAKQPVLASKKVSAEKNNKKPQKNNYPAKDKSLNDIIFNEGFKNNFLGSSGSAGSSEQKGGASERAEKGRKFFFEIGTELIVYGRTEPDAEVKMNDKKIDLRNDGTFSMRFAFPDGKIPLDFIATSNDKIDKRTITTSAERAKTTLS